MKKLLPLILVMLLSGCTTLSFHTSAVQTQAIDPLSLRTPKPVRFDLGENPDTYEIKVKEALLASGVFVEDDASPRTLSISLTVNKNPPANVFEASPEPLVILTLGMFPEMSSISIDTTLVLSHAGAKEDVYQYRVQRYQYVSFLAPIMGRSYDASAREFGAIVGTNVLNDMNQRGAL